MGSNKDDIKPINLKTEKEITNEFQKISTVLENQNADWNKRLEALKTLQGMVVGNTWTHELFMPYYLKLYPFINFQLKDLRSAVQKEACKLLSISAEKMQKSFEQVAIKYVSKDSLLTIINSGNKTLCENAHFCIQSIIEYCPSPSYMSQILEECSSKSQQVRSRILPELNQMQLDKYLPQLDQTISKGVSDANPEVRQNIRSAFGIYYQLYPQKAEKIYSNSDTQTKKLLQEEMNNGNDSQNYNQNTTSYSSNNKLVQQKSLDSNVGNYLTQSQNTAVPQKLQQSASLSTNDDNHYHFASSSSNSLTISSQVAQSQQRNLNKTPTHQQKINNLHSNGMSSSTSNNNLNKSRNGSGHFSQERGIVNNLKQVSDQITHQQSNKDRINGSRVSPIRGDNRESVSPLKGNSQKIISITSDSSKPPVSSKNTNQGGSYAQANFSAVNQDSSNYALDQQKLKNQQGQQANIQNQRYNNHQSALDNKVSFSSNNIPAKGQPTEARDVYENNSRKANAFRSQDPKKNYNENLQQSQIQDPRVNNSLIRPSNQTGLKKPAYQKRNSLTEENQNSLDSGLDYEQHNNVKKSQPTKQVQINQNGKVGQTKNNFMKQGVKQQNRNEQYNDNNLDEDQYENFNRRSNHEDDEQFEDEDQENDDIDDYDDNEQNNNQNENEFDDEDDESIEQQISYNSKNNKQKVTENKNQNQTKQKRGNYSISNIKNDYDDYDQQNLSDYDDNTHHSQNRQKKNIKNYQYGRDDDNQFVQNNQKSGNTEGGKRIVKSAMNSLKNSDSKNATKQQNIQQVSTISQNKSRAISPSRQQISGNVSTKHNNFMVQNEIEDRYLRQNISPPVDDDQVNRYSNNFKNKQQKQLTKSSNTLSKVSNVQKIGMKEQDGSIALNQQQYSWRDEDLELLLNKINNNTNTNWSTRVSAFESIKEVIGELSNQIQQTQNSKQVEVERINPALMKRIISAHIDHLSDSHFKVVSVCLDSLITLVSYDSQQIIPKLDQLIFKILLLLNIILLSEVYVLNNLIDTKDVVSSKANFFVNILSKIFPGEKLIEPIQKVLEQTNKNLLKICSLEVLMVTVKNAEEYYQSISNVRHTIQLLSLIILENQNQKQMALPCLGIILALRDHNSQGTLHSILSLTNQNQITALRTLAYEYAQDLEEDLRKYAQKENIKPTDKIPKTNLKQQQIEQNTSAVVNASTVQLQNSQMQGQNGKGQQANQQNLQKSQVQNQQMQKSKVQGTGKTTSSSPEKNQMVDYPTQHFDIKRIEEIYSCVSDFEQNESFIIQYVNDILLNTIEFFKQQSRKVKEQALKILQCLFMRNYFYLTIQPHTVFECLSIYPHISKDMDFYQVDEVIEEMVDCVPHLIFMKALVEKINTEKPPQLQIMIKKISYILRKARKEEIRPFLDHIIDSFKISINDTSPDVRKSVVFCLVDLKVLMQEEVDPYLHQFTGNQQKLVDIYIKKRINNDGNGGQD